MVDQTLANPKSWTHNPQFAFVRIDGTDKSKPDIRVSLSSPMTVREGCGYEFPLETSCYNPSYGAEAQPRVFINEARWVRGAVSFQGDVGSYRQYLINHEVGHAIGYLRHEPCDKQGGLAPIMMQQTFSTCQRRRREVRPGVGQARRQDLPVQSLALPDRLARRRRRPRSPAGSLAGCLPFAGQLL